MKLKCPSPLCITSESDNAFRKRLEACNCMSIGKKKYSESYSATKDSAFENVKCDTCKKQTRNRSVAFLKRIGNNMLLHLSTGANSKTSNTTDHQVYRAFDEDRYMPPSLYRVVTNLSPPLMATSTDDTITTLESDARNNSGDLRAFSVALGSTSELHSDRNRCIYRSFHQYVFTPQTHVGNGKYTIERKHKVKKRDRLQMQSQQESQQTNQEFRKGLQKQMKPEFKTQRESFATNSDIRTGKACIILNKNFHIIYQDKQ